MNKTKMQCRVYDCQAQVTSGDNHYCAKHADDMAEIEYAKEGRAPYYNASAENFHGNYEN